MSRVRIGNYCSKRSLLFCILFTHWLLVYLQLCLTLNYSLTVNFINKCFRFHYTEYADIIYQWLKFSFNNLAPFTARLQIKRNVSRKCNFLWSSKATKCSTMGIVKVIYYDWSTSGEALTNQTERKEWKPATGETERARAPEYKRSAQLAVGTHSDIPNPRVLFEKGTHTSDTRESLPARRNYLGLSISVSRTIEIASLSCSALGCTGVPFAFNSFMSMYLNGFGMCVSFPQVATLGHPSGRWKHASGCSASFVRQLGIPNSIYEKKRYNLDWLNKLPCYYWMVDRNYRMPCTVEPQ